MHTSSNTSFIYNPIRNIKNNKYKLAKCLHKKVQIHYTRSFIKQTVRMIDKDVIYFDLIL